jgi:hypothetical protein
MLLLVVEDQGHARQPQQVEVAEDRSPADRTSLGQAVGVITPSSLE